MADLGCSLNAKLATFPEKLGRGDMREDRGSKSTAWAAKKELLSTKMGKAEEQKEQQPRRATEVTLAT